jgi:ankyrin repeat protein
MKIHRYAHRGIITGVQQELDRGVDIDMLDTQAKFVNANFFFEGMTPLQCALASPLAGTDMVRFLYDRGAKRSFDFNQGKSDPYWAIQSGKIEKIQLLLDLGANINCMEEDDNYPLLDDLFYKSQEDALALVEFLITKGVKFASGNRSTLALAAGIGRFDIVRVLLGAGCDPTVLGWNDLMYAVGLGTISELETLLAQDPNLANLTVVNNNQQTPWLLSVHMGDVPKAQLLLTAGSNPFAIGSLGQSPLMYAIESGNISMLTWLIDIGLDLNATDERGETPLMCAVDLDRADAVSILLEAGAIPSLALSWGEKAIDKVLSEKVLQLLLAAGEDLNHIGPSSGEGSSITPSIRSMVTKVALPDEWKLDFNSYQLDKERRFGHSNPEKVDAPFWREMVKFRWPAYVIHGFYQGENLAIWCFHRFGQSITLLPDGRVIEIGGEHEDRWDRDFCIYNDVVVYDGRGDFQIYGYPRDVFPPTDFHTATWVDGWIYIIGNVGYDEDRLVSETPVYRLNCTTYEIEKVITTGECPSWIGCHQATLQDRQIHISGGKIDVIDQDTLTYIDNQTEYIFNLQQYCWYRSSI